MEKESIFLSKKQRRKSREIFTEGRYIYAEENITEKKKGGTYLEKEDTFMRRRRKMEKKKEEIIIKKEKLLRTGGQKLKALCPCGPIKSLCSGALLK